MGLASQTRSSCTLIAASACTRAVHNYLPNMLFRNSGKDYLFKFLPHYASSNIIILALVLQEQKCNILMNLIVSLLEEKKKIDWTDF